MKPPSSLTGAALLEALVALGVLASAGLGLLALQLRSDVEGQWAAQRVVATRLAQDLFERVKANPGGAAVLTSYLNPADAVSGAPRGPADCRTQACGPQALAAWDLDQWHRQVGRDLPMGQASVFAADGADGADGQFGVLLAWRAPEAVRAADYLAPLSVSAPSGGARLSCPERMICQLLYSAP